MIILILFFVLAKSLVYVKTNNITISVDNILANNNYLYYFNVSTIPTKYDLGYMNFGNCSNTILIDNQPTINSYVYTEEQLINSCKFETTNSNDILTITGNIFIKAEKCISSKIKNYQCSKGISESSILINTNLTIENNLETSSSTNASITIEDNDKLSTIENTFSSVLSYKGENYSNPIETLEIYGNSLLCFRQTILGINNVSVSYDENPFNTIIKCKHNNILINIDLSNYPCSNNVETGIDLTNNFYVEYCNSFTSNDFDNINDCKGNYISEIILTSNYERRFLSETSSGESKTPFIFENLKNDNKQNGLFYLNFLLIGGLFLILFLILNKKKNRIYASN